ncbi:hypothetical protein DRN94_002590, partial [archaeon]|nr:hypothetical protein [archaeon]
MRLELATTAVFLIAFAFAVAGVGSGVMSLSVATGFLATVMGFWGLYATWIYAVKVKKLASIFEDLESVVYAFCSVLCLLGGVSALILSVA